MKGETSIAALTPGKHIRMLPEGSILRTSELPGSSPAARNAVSRAVARRELVSLRRGLYYKGKKTRYGVAKPPPINIALEILGARGVGPTGVSAARALGLSTQVPAVPELVTVGPVPENLSGVKIHKRNNLSRYELNYTEIAVLEVLRDWEYTTDSSWKDLTIAIRKKIGTGEINFSKLQNAASGEYGVEVKKRFKALIVNLDFLAT